jgi:hypothetical protein
MMTRLASTYSPNYFRDEREGKIRADDFWDDLKHLHPDDLAAACKAVRKIWGLKGEFGMPTPAIILREAGLARIARESSEARRALPDHGPTFEERLENIKEINRIVQEAIERQEARQRRGSDTVTAASNPDGQE